MIALQEKKIETRSWSTNYRGSIAIHAGKKIDTQVFEQPLYIEIFNNYGITPQNIIVSSIIATCNIVDVIATEDLINCITKKEQKFGNYSPNRFGWILNDIKPIEPITDVKGMLGLWNYQPL